MSNTAGGGVMDKMKNSPIFICLVTILFTLILGSYAYTYSESAKATPKDTFNMFLVEYRNNTTLMFDMIKALKE